MAHGISRKLKKKHSNEPVAKNGIALNFTYCRASTTTKNIKKKQMKKVLQLMKIQSGNEETLNLFNSRVTISKRTNRSDFHFCCYFCCDIFKLSKISFHSFIQTDYGIFDVILNTFQICLSQCVFVFVWARHFLFILNKQNLQLFKRFSMKSVYFYIHL